MNITANTFLKQLTLILAILIFNNLLLSAQEIQNTSNIWYFGDRAGLDFNTTPPTALTNGQLDTQEGVASISNNFGELLFYSDGITIWDRNHQAMPNGNGNLNGHPSSTQSALIIPHPGEANQFYVFTTDELAGNNGLSYSLVDMSLVGNGTVAMPLGNVVASELNIQLKSPVTEKTAGILKPDGTGFWLVAHGWNNNRFYAYEITCAGISTNPVISEIGNTHSGGSNNINSVGYMKATIDGERLALVNRNNNTVDVYDFDPLSGMVSNELEITPNDVLLYGIEFSPSGEYLYIGGSDIISRYSFSDNSLSDIIIDSAAPFSSSNGIRALQLGPDENIYVSIRNWDYISIIFGPDGNIPILITEGIDINPDGNGRNCRFGLPNIFYADLFPLDSITIPTCFNEQAEYNGEFYEPGTTNEVHLVNDLGCDSTVILIVYPLGVSEQVFYFNICEGNSYDYKGTLIPAGSQETFLFTNTNGCDSSITIVANIIDEIPSQSLTISACPNEQVEYNGEFYQVGTTTEIFLVDDLGCDSIVILTIAEFETSDEQLEFDSCEESFYDFNGTLIPAGSQETFFFTNSNGCDSIITVLINVVDVIVENIAIDLCEGETYLYNNEAYPIGTDTSFQFIDQNGCENLVTLSVALSPILEFELNTESACSDVNNGSVSIQNINGGISPFEYSIDGENYFTDTTINELASSSYTFLVQDANACIFEQTFEILEIPEIELEYQEPILSCDNDSLLLLVTPLNAEVNEVNWNWENGSQSNSITVVEPGIYNLEVSNNCESIIEDINVELEGYLREDFVYIPNAFSPNYDGLNDFFKIFPSQDLEITNFELQIFNRWGALVFQSDDLNNTWDGTLNGKAFEPGVFVWWLKIDAIACKRNISIFKEGDISIIR